MSKEQGKFIKYLEQEVGTTTKIAGALFGMFGFIIVMIILFVTIGL